MHGVGVPWQYGSYEWNSQPAAWHALKVLPQLEGFPAHAILPDHEQLVARQVVLVVLAEQSRGVP